MVYHGLLTLIIMSICKMKKKGHFLLSAVEFLRPRLVRSYVCLCERATVHTL